MDERAAGGRASGWILAELFLLGLLLAWWLAARDLPAYILPDPLSVARATAAIFLDAGRLEHALTSLLRVAASVVVATVLAFALALTARLVPLLAEIVNGRILTFFSSFPSVGWAVLAVIWFEMSDVTVVFVQVAILLPFCLINISEGLRQMDEDLLEMGRSFTRSQPRLVRKLMVPMLAPYVISAVRIAYGIAWKVALVSELFGAGTGLGYLLLQAQIVGDAAMVFATCLAIVLLFALGDRLVIAPIERRYGVQKGTRT